MPGEFPRLLKLLRTEKHISQKEAAERLEVSQSLLSHYEKGIRECSLDFLIRAADFYGVSADYLLGRTAERGSAPAPEEGEASRDSVYRGNIYSAMYKRLLSGSIDLLFQVLGDAPNKEFAAEAGHYLSLAVYRVFRRMYSRTENPQELFSLKEGHYEAQTGAEMLLSEMRLKDLPCELDATYESMSRSAPVSAQSLMNLVKNTEDKLKKDKDSEK